MTFLNTKTFFLGVGAQKAGTTWLYHYLKVHPQVFMSPIKELHYFDAKFRPDVCCQFDRRAVYDLLRQFKAYARYQIVGGSPVDREHLAARVDRVAMIYRKKAYKRYFEKRVPERAKAFGEMTPSYSLLTAAGFDKIREMRADTRLIYLMRDPVERHWSSLRHHERRNRGFSAKQSFFESLQDEQFLGRGDYETTFRQILKVFPREQIFVGFYETLFTERTIGEICDFLEIDYQTADFDRVYNTSPNDDSLTPEMHAAGAEAFARTYDFVSREFGARVPAEWCASPGGYCREAR